MLPEIRKKQINLEQIPPNFNPSVLKVTKLLLPWWLKLQTDIKKIEAEKIDILVDLYRQFKQEKIRLLLAFRHPRIDDPLCLADLFWRILPQACRRRGVELDDAFHAHFIYDRGIPLWAGGWVGWLYSRLGGSSIQRGKLDLAGLKAARNLFVNGQFPLAIAPEGGTNGHNEIVSPLEPGIAQLSFWCLEDLRQEKRPEEDVIILPMGIKYSYLDRPWREIEILLSQLETDCGLNDRDNLPGNNEANSELIREELYSRLLKIAEYLLSEIEQFYLRFYPQHSSPISPGATTEINPNESISLRLPKILDTALQVSEHYFNVQPRGNLVDRCRRLEQASWDYIYQSDSYNGQTKSSLIQGLANHVAEEAKLQIWHMRIVESFVAVTGYYVREKPTAERFAETLFILWDLLTRIKGGNPLARPKLGNQRVTLTMGEPISIKSLYPQYKSNRRQTIDNLTDSLQQALQFTVENE